VSVPLTKIGDKLELRGAAYFQAHGYLVRRSVSLAVAAGTADATDIDLLAIRFSVPLAEERLVADCKDRRKPKPFERILWVRGLASFANAGKAIVVLPRSVWQAREFANQGGVEIIESLEIEKFLKTTAKSFVPFGEASNELSVRRGQNSNRELARESTALRQMLVTGHPLTNLNRIISRLSKIGKIREGDFWMLRYICFDAAVIASVMLVRFAAESKWTPEKDWSAYARKKLTFGDVSPNKALQLAQYALDRKIVEGIPAPAYTNEIIQLIKSLIINPNVAASLPIVLDRHLFDQVLMKRPRPALPQTTDDDEVLKLARRTLSAISYAAGIPASIWQTSSHENIATPTKVTVKSATDGTKQPLLHSTGETSVETPDLPANVADQLNTSPK